MSYREIIKKCPTTKQFLLSVIKFTKWFDHNQQMTSNWQPKKNVIGNFRKQTLIWRARSMENLKRIERTHENTKSGNLGQNMI